MLQIHCHIPLKLRFAGEPQEDQWDALEEKLVTFYSRLIARGLSEVERGWPASASALQPLREPFSEDRARPEGYWIPNYQGGGTETPVPLADQTTLTADPAADQRPDVNQIASMIKGYFAVTGGLPDNEGYFGVYLTGRGAATPRLFYVTGPGRSADELRMEVLHITTRPLTGSPATVGLAPGSYTLDVRPHGPGAVYSGPRLVRTVHNPDNRDLRIRFFVPSEPGIDEVVVRGAPRYRFYPQLRILRVRSQTQLTDGAEGVYLAEVQILRADISSNGDVDWVPVFGLAWIYAFITYQWTISKIVKDRAEQERRETVRTAETRNAFLHHEWAAPGTYEIACEITVRYENASPRPVREYMREIVIDLRSKMARDLALLEHGETLPGAERVWQPDAGQFLNQIRQLIAAEKALPTPNQARIRGLEDALHKAERQVQGTTAAGPFALRAIFTDRHSAETRPLSLFIGPAANHGPDATSVTWKLIDLTYPPFYRTSTGTDTSHGGAIRAAFEDARTTFTGNYPPGRILVNIDFPNMANFGGLTRWDFSIETESWQRTAYEWLSVGAQVVGAISLAAAFVFPPSAIVTGAIVIGITTGATVSVINIVERIRTNSWEWDGQAVADIINLAASFALIAGTVTRGVARGVSQAIASGTNVEFAASRLATLVRFQRGFLYMGLTADISNGVLISVDTYLQIRDIDAAVDTSVLASYQRIYGEVEGRKRWETERYTRIIGILARAALNGGLTAVSIRGARRAMAESAAHQPSTAPGTVQQTATGRITSATTPAEYLQALRDETHTAGGVGRGWDHQRFPQAPPGEQWRPGDPIDMPSSTGDYVQYNNTARPRWWRNRAHLEMQARARGEVQQATTGTRDPIRMMSDAELQNTRDTGTTPKDPFHPGRTMELEHAGVPQRVRDWLKALGFASEEAARITEVSNPGRLTEETPLEHAFWDVEAHRFGKLRADPTGRRFNTTDLTDPRRLRPLIAMSDAAITQIVQQAQARGYNWNRTKQTRQLRDAIRSEVQVRTLPVTPP